MADTPWKEGDSPLRRVRSGQPAAALSYPAQLYGAPWVRVHQSQDQVLAGRRQLLHVGIGGSREWQVGNGASGGASQTYPSPSTWRVVADAWAELGPGAALELRVLALPSGGTETEITHPPPTPNSWEQYGPAGAVKLELSYETPTGTQTVTIVRPIPASSPLVDGQTNTDPGAAWAELQHVFVPDIRPGIASQASVAARSDDTRVRLTMSYRGGARVIEASVCEVPDRHVRSHDLTAKTGPSTAHDWPTSTGLPHKQPRIKGVDGATHDEPRFGPLRGFAVARRQTAKLGPRLWSWSSHAERLAEVADTDPDPVEVTSTSLVSILGTTQTAWDPDAPGWDIVGAYCRSPNNLATRMRGNACAIPVRVWVHARFTTNLGVKTGVVRFQSTARSWVEIEVPESSTWAWYSATAYLEANESSRDADAIVQVLARVSAGTMQIRYHCGEFGFG